MCEMKCKITIIFILLWRAKTLLFTFKDRSSKISLDFLKENQQPKDGNFNCALKSRQTFVRQLTSGSSIAFLFSL